MTPRLEAAVMALAELPQEVVEQLYATVADFIAYDDAEAEGQRILLEVMDAAAEAGTLNN